jgi:hypothetical protein
MVFEFRDGPFSSNMLHVWSFVGGFCTTRKPGCSCNNTEIHSMLRYSHIPKSCRVSYTLGLHMIRSYFTSTSMLTYLFFMHACFNG